MRKAVPKKLGKPDEKSGPRYRQVAEDLSKRIAAGHYKVGSRIPTEVELARTYSISRHTVREALRRLRDAGLIVQRKRAGTEVLASRPQTGYRQPINSIDDLLQYAGDTRLILLKKRRIRCNNSLAQLLVSEPGSEWLRLETTRVLPGDSRPICITVSYVTTDFPDIEHHLEHLSRPVSAILESAYGLRLQIIEQGIQAVRLTPAQARLLKCEPDAPALRAVRRYYDQNHRLLQLSDALHPGDRFTYIMKLNRE